MTYDKTLNSPDDITVTTYFKCTECPSPNIQLQNVYVQSINAELGTVNARIGETDSYIDYKKEELFAYINFYKFSF